MALVGGRACPGSFVATYPLPWGPAPEPVVLDVQWPLAARCSSRALGVHPNPKAAAGGAAVSSTRAPALQVWQILDQASSDGPGDQMATLALCLQVAQEAVSDA